jgi:signal transduction histidine kinase
MASTTYGHSINGNAAQVNDLVQHLRSDLKARAPVVKLEERLSEIEAAIKRIQETQITVPLSSGEGVESVLIYDLLQERIQELRKWGRCQSVECKFDPTSEKCATVRASSEWLIQAFDILVDNAVEAMTKSTQKILTISIQLKDNRVDIKISDTGKGIPKKVMPKFLRDPIKKPEGAKGAGMGLLLAQIILQTYGGDIYLHQTGPAGTTMVAWLPLETERGAGE